LPSHRFTMGVGHDLCPRRHPSLRQGERRQRYLWIVVWWGAGRWMGESDGVRAHLFPSLKIVLKAEFLLEFAEREEEELADEGQIGGGAGRDAVVGDGPEEFAEGEIDEGREQGG
jgi:hypothetical protein